MKCGFPDYIIYLKLWKTTLIWHLNITETFNAKLANAVAPAAAAGVYRSVTKNTTSSSRWSVPKNLTDESTRLLSCLKQSVKTTTGTYPLTGWAIARSRIKTSAALYLEKGENYFPTVCRLFPRSLKNINGVNVACCSASCEKTVEMLFKCSDLNLQEMTIKESPQFTYDVSEDDIEQIKLFNEIIKDRSSTLAQSLSDICMIINKNEFVKDFDSDEDGIETGIRLLKRLSGENYELSELACKLEDRYLNDHEQFNIDKEVFESRYPEWMNFLERLINNSMIYECFPFIDKRADKTRVYKGLCFCYGLLRLVCIYTGSNSTSKEDLIDAVSLLFHLIDHTSFYYNVSVLSENAAVMLKI